MKYIDLSIQTLIMLFALGLLIISVGGNEGIEVLLYAQLFLGPWQLLSSLVSIIARSPFYVNKRIHFFASILYLIFLYAYGMQSIMLLIIPSWTLGLLYYVLTWKWILIQTKKRGSFLPNLSF